MKIIIAPDKFKGSLTSFEVCQAVAAGITNADVSAQALLFPMADGGDGFAAVMKHYLGTETVDSFTIDPIGRKIKGSYEWDAKRSAAIIEMAVSSGLVLLQAQERNPLKTSTYGTGLLIKDAFAKGVKKIILGLGGSATNDAGTGILAALGFRFSDPNGIALAGSGENLPKIERIIAPVDFPKIKFEIACDVQNKLYGPHGAAYVYARQKGANDEQIKVLDEGLKHFAGILKKDTGTEVGDIPGTGAAGGIAAGLMGYFDVALKKGIDLVMQASEIKKEMKGADLLITGEGKIDAQTLAGKVVSEVSLLASQYKIPVVAFCGTAELNKLQFTQLGLQSVQTLVGPSISKEKALANAREILTNKVSEFFKQGLANGL
ncbi:MAG TPA: glycerate kinase, partial [Chitinophagaceae bacterium]|nr:glycerate kinase [Chitinophagaceae bacterium]